MGLGKSGQHLEDPVGEVCLDLTQGSEKLSSHNLGCFFEEQSQYQKYL